MATSTRSNTGCWTCRVRRKKCDERGPPCSTCELLQLECHGYSERPWWMDGGVQEQNKARAFKSLVKRNTAARRQDRARKRFSENQNDKSADPKLKAPLIGKPDGRVPEYIQTSISETMYNSSSTREWPLGSVDLPDLPVLDTSVFDHLDHLPENLDDFGASSLGIESIGGFSTLESFFGSAGSLERIEGHSKDINKGREVSIVDNEQQWPVNIAFPVTLPLSPLSPLRSEDRRPSDCGLEYQASETRNLPLAVNKAPKTSNGLLSAYELPSIRFYTSTIFPELFPFVFRENTNVIHEHLIMTLNRSRLCLLAILAQSEYYQKLQLQRFGLTAGDFKESVLYKERKAVEGLQHKLHASNFLNEVTTNNQSLQELLVCTTLILLSQSIRGSSDWQRLIENTASLIPALIENSNTTDQIWKNFIQEVLVTVEILGCTFTGYEPRLSVTIMTKERTTRQLSWKTITGLENWLLSCLLEITMLRRWKEKQMSQNSLSLTELVKRGLRIEQDLQYQRQAVSTRIKDSLPYDLCAFTNVFASAVYVFLHATISSPLPQIPEIKKGVSDTIDAVRLLPRPDLLKRLAWPLCIAACMAEPRRYDFFNSLSDRVTEAYGKDENVSRAFEVARECWRLRGSREQDDQTYDWRDAMRSLGTPWLLF